MYIFTYVLLLFLYAFLHFHATQNSTITTSNEPEHAPSLSQFNSACLHSEFFIIVPVKSLASTMSARPIWRSSEFQKTIEEAVIHSVLLACRGGSQLS